MHDTRMDGWMDHERGRITTRINEVSKVTHLTPCWPDSVLPAQLAEQLRMRMRM
jgi:hypothetical protein